MPNWTDAMENTAPRGGTNKYVSVSPYLYKIKNTSDKKDVWQQMITETMHSFCWLRFLLHFSPRVLSTTVISSDGAQVTEQIKVKKPTFFCATLTICCLVPSLSFSELVGSVWLKVLFIIFLCLSPDLLPHIGPSEPSPWTESSPVNVLENTCRQYPLSTAKQNKVGHCESADYHNLSSLDSGTKANIVIWCQRQIWSRSVLSFQIRHACCMLYSWLYQHRQITSCFQEF